MNSRTNCSNLNGLVIRLTGFSWNQQYLICAMKFIPFELLGEIHLKTVIICWFFWSQPRQENKKRHETSQKKCRSKKNNEQNKKLIACRSNYRGGYPLHFLYCYWDGLFLYWCWFHTIKKFNKHFLPPQNSFFSRCMSLFRWGGFASECVKHF